jgi:LuxR family maltose regulon positive regulatory protein
MLVDAAAAVELEPPGSPWHPAAMAALGVAHAVTGAREQAAKELELAAELGRDRQRPAAVTALAELSLLAAEADDWPTAALKSAEALRLMEDGGIQEHVFCMLAFAAAARVAAHRGDGETARRHVGSTLRQHASPSPAAFPWLSVQVADELHTSRNTVKTHVAAVYRKLQCSTRTEAVHRGRDLGLLEP